MTGTREPQQDGSIQAMLRDSGLEASTGLRSSLEELRALVPDRAPAPRADLAELLSAGAPGFSARGSAAGASAATTTAMPAVASAPEYSDEALPAGVTSLAERRGRKRRLAIVGGAVVGAMTLGAGAVAASSGDFRESVSHTVGLIFQPSGGKSDVAPEPAKPSPADIPAAPVPSKAGATTPPAADTVPQAPGSDGGVPAKPGAATPPAIGRGGVLPTPPHRPVTPGVPALPGSGGERDLPANPLPEPTLPGVLPTVPSS
ncbi:hypothetical protein NicSoilB4_03920 [Arthrobacter sp. NicSoilB4]|uniref:hypothetical protein n=1 Tax=Arthrobacter sp. NicSoilB4 TaxID=2830997 RepID=UPI001CC38C80|nr:hypothetical protein [Arthrobacter sp. NicSoilB4]BCW65629.1 hypothetical protein NicSoilB4_03920 [Arthrobacter sp. NicSoilB4]